VSSSQSRAAIRFDWGLPGAHAAGEPLTGPAFRSDTELSGQA